MYVEKIFGQPGAGKTTRLIETAESFLDKGVAPDRIAYVSFTRKAAEEAKVRAKEKFNLSDRDLPLFRTLHSFAFTQLGLSTSEVMQTEDYKEIGERLNLGFRGSYKLENAELPVIGNDLGDRCAHYHSIARALNVPVEIVLRKAQDRSLRPNKLRQYVGSLANYKRARHKWDFTDMLERWIDYGERVPIEVLIVDEAQDLTPLQWVMIEKLKTMARFVYIAGDDDQSIYRWAGARVSRFLNQPGEMIVLEENHRLPKPVFDLGQRIIRRVKNRVPKDCFVKEERPGAVRFYGDWRNIDFSKGEWLILTRENWIHRHLCAVLDDRCIPFIRGEQSSLDLKYIRAIVVYEELRSGRPISQREADLIRVHSDHIGRAEEDRDYHFGELFQENRPWQEALNKMKPERRLKVEAMIKAGESINRPPRIRISSIHGSKGAQADNVILLTGISSTVDEKMRRNRIHYEDEHRVFYVGATRAKENLYIVRNTFHRFPINPLPKS